MGFSGTVTCPSYADFCGLGWIGLGPENGFPPSVSPTTAPTNTGSAKDTTVEVSNRITFVNALSSTQQTLVKDVYKSNLLGTFPHATWTVSISSSRRFSSYTLSATGVGTVSEAQLQASQTSFAATLTTQLTNNGFTGVTVEEYKYSVDKDDEFCVLGLCGTVLYAAGGGAALLLLT